MQFRQSRAYFSSAAAVHQFSRPQFKQTDPTSWELIYVEGTRDLNSVARSAWEKSDTQRTADSERPKCTWAILCITRTYNYVFSFICLLYRWGPFREDEDFDALLATACSRLAFGLQDHAKKCERGLEVNNNGPQTLIPFLWEAYSKLKFMTLKSDLSSKSPFTDVHSNTQESPLPNSVSEISKSSDFLFLHEILLASLLIAPASDNFVLTSWTPTGSFGFNKVQLVCHAIESVGL
jgi:hypothetical protein